jgi:hypothetical protein
MYKKDQKTVKYTLPMSNMRVVLMSIERGNNLRRDIEAETKLGKRKVNSALLNLKFIGAIKVERRLAGRTLFYIEGQITEGVAHNLKGINSIFNLAPLPLRKL